MMHSHPRQTTSTSLAALILLLSVSLPGCDPGEDVSDGERAAATGECDTSWKCLSVSGGGSITGPGSTACTLGGRTYHCCTQPGTDLAVHNNQPSSFHCYYLINPSASAQQNPCAASLQVKSGWRTQCDVNNGCDWGQCCGQYQYADNQNCPSITVRENGIGYYTYGFSECYCTAANGYITPGQVCKADTTLRYRTGMGSAPSAGSSSGSSSSGSTTTTYPTSPPAAQPTNTPAPDCTATYKVGSSSACTLYSDGKYYTQQLMEETTCRTNWECVSQNKCPAYQTFELAPCTPPAASSCASVCSGSCLSPGCCAAKHPDCYGSWGTCKCR